MYAEDADTKREWYNDLEQLIEEARSDPSADNAPAGELCESADSDASLGDSSVAFQMEADEAKGAQSLKMAQLESRIVGFKAFAKPGRTFLKEGSVFVNPRSNLPSDLKQRHFFMFNDILLIAKRHGDSAKKSFHAKDIIPLSSVLVQDLDLGGTASGISSDTMHMFEIVRLDTKTKVLVKCADGDVKSEWVEALSDAMESGALRKGAEVETSISYENILRDARGSKRLSNSSPLRRGAALERRSSSDVKQCAHCTATFGLSRQRKRCGFCDAVCCGSCCSKKKNKLGKPTRVCEKCFLKA
eukprot:TRINITY_DN7285_c0_g1_i1.p2 TRINITY_DN7285_c0_g1~~TRINITY_DN7285_c0_g1_i1.p2  ORF type:complete len:301 (-),score=119.36 TRINITY_DN7285_c0_g1_i1:215-1117(-)